MIPYKDAVRLLEAYKCDWSEFEHAHGTRTEYAIGVVVAWMGGV